MNRQLSAALLLLPAGAAFAATTTANLAVSAHVPVSVSCSVQVPDLNFGDVTAGQPSRDTSAGLGVTCTQGQPYSIALNAGEHYDADSGSRQMVSGDNGIAYLLILGGVQWGDGDSYPAGQPVSGTGTGQATSFNLTARVFTNAQTPVGNYSDRVLVTVSY